MGIAKESDMQGMTQIIPERTMQLKTKILIIEDDYEMREALNALLRRKNYDVDTAKTAAEALVKLRVRHYEIVITDIVVPPITGLLLMRMMGRPLVSDFIVITGVDTPENREEALQLGARGYFVKPFDSNDLLEMIHEIIGCRK